MTKILSEVLEANQKYSANFGEKGKLALPPARSFASLTCMDARLDPAKYAGLAEGDAHVIRNAGGRASDDAIRSLVISYKLLGTREFFVIHHTDCGMEFFTNDVMRNLLASSLETAALTPQGFKDVGRGPGSRAGEYIEWLTISNQKQAVLDDVARIRNQPLAPKSIPIGRLGRDPETRYTGGGQAVANFSLATDETYKDRNGERQKRTEWHKIVVWGKQAEIAQQYLKKGSLIFIEGRIQSREWQDKEGQKRTSFEIVATNFRMLGGRADGAAAGAGGGGMGGCAPRRGDEFDAGAGHDDHAAPGAGPEISDEDIPF